VHRAAPAQYVCPVIGESIHWIADYCMNKNGTDDFFNSNVQDCYNREELKVKKENQDSCIVKKYYKKKLCIIQKEFYGNSWERCVRDKEFLPKSVRGNGVEL